MRYNEISEGIFDDIQQSGLLDGMSDYNFDNSIQSGIETLQQYGAIETESHPKAGCGYISFGTTIPLSYSDKEKLLQEGWVQDNEDWPPNNDFVEKYGFLVVQV